MATNEELQKQIANLEAAQKKAEILYQISHDLNSARDEQELLQLLDQPARAAGAASTNLFYIDLDEAGQPEWARIVAFWYQNNKPVVEVGTAYYLPEFSFTDLFFSSPDKPSLISDAKSDKTIDKNTQILMAQTDVRATAIIPLTQRFYHERSIQNSLQKLTEQRWIGLITFNWREPHEFSKQEVEIYDSLIGLASPAVENRRLANNLGQMIEDRTAELQQSQQMLQLVLDTIPIRVFWKDKDLNYLGCNCLFADDAGLDSPEEIIGKNDFDLAWAEQAELYRADDQKMIDSGEAKVNYDEPQTTSDGSQLWLRTSKFPLRDVEGNITGILGTYDDITAQIQSEKELVETKALMEAVFEQSSIPMVVASVPDMVIQVANPAAEESLGIADEGSKIGQSMTELEQTWQDFDSDGNPIPLGELPLGKALQGIETRNAEYRMIRKDGTERWNLVHGVPIYNNEGELIAGLTIFPDITARKQTEAERERMLTIIESSADFITLATPEGKGLYINSAGLAMIGYTQEEFDAGMNIAEIQPGLSSEVFEIAVTEGMWSGEGTLVHKNGHQMIISQTITSLKDDAGNLQGFSTIIRDITEIRQTESERERLQKEIIEAQQRAIAELSTPVIPVMDRIIVMPLVGSIDSMRARDITRSLLAGISQHRAKVVILDVTGVGIMDTGIVNHLNKTIQAARLKGAQTIVTGISDAVAEAIVDLGIDWSKITTLSDLQTGLITALDSLGVRLTR